MTGPVVSAAGGLADAVLHERVRKEIEAVHRFISAWFRGEVGQSKTTFQEQLADRFAPGFVNIQPSGRVLARSELLSSIQDGYGSNPEFAISIADCTFRYVQNHGPLVMATYTEHQQGAKNTDPPDNVRISSALFEIPSGQGRPTWLHLHETGLAR